MIKELITEEYLISEGFKKWGRDDMPATISYEKEKLLLQPLYAHGNYTKKKIGYGSIWIKDEPNNSLSWRPLIIAKYKKDLEVLQTFLTAFCNARK